MRSHARFVALCMMMGCIHNDGDVGRMQGYNNLREHAGWLVGQAALLYPFIHVCLGSVI